MTLSSSPPKDTSHRKHAQQSHSMATKRLTFKSNNLQKDMTLMLCFTPPDANLLVDLFPIAWKVTTFAARAQGVLNVTWTADLAVSATQVEGSLVTAGNYTPIRLGQTTKLHLDQATSPPIRYWSNPKALPNGDPDMIYAVNRTGRQETIGIGFITDLNTPDEDVSLALASPNVRDTLTLSAAAFTPLLTAYLVGVGDYDYKQGQLIKGDIVNETPIWMQHLPELQPNTTVVIGQDATGAYTVEEK
ncbi:hypothetical protein OH76DRAFT_1482987 [Lentinus brumalis]|uniref:Uncharacterized protein n=1 Tax=Lentinus brumalis TaxID=2498619 RepID=A0A371DAQ3_9APHY|nr:hypothetical protein OH76DRAFT_1482987 [Polyporus brumalis]